MRAERAPNETERTAARLYLVELRLFTLLMLLVAVVVWDGKRRFPTAIEIAKPADLRRGAVVEVRRARAELLERAAEGVGR